ncbi:MAG: M48 family metalloprotease [Thiogranum sp.]
MISRRNLLPSLALLGAGLLSGCSTNPVTGGHDFVLMSESDEIQLGREYHEQVIKEMPVYNDPELAAYVNEVGQRLARASHRPELEYHFTVLDSPMVNAFALPGGYVYITRGIMAYLNSEAEMAAVLGHEIGHVTARHSVRRHSASTATGVAGAVLGAATGIPASQDLFNTLGKAMLSGYGREHELESDRLGAQYLARTGYDPRAMLEVIGVLKNQELLENQRAREEGREARSYHGVFASHPENDRRLQEVVGEAEHLKTVGEPRLGRETYLQHLEGLVFGTSENEGVAVGSRFYHKPLDFGVDFGEGWSISNQTERLVAASPDDAAIVELTVVPRPARTTPKQFLKQQGVREALHGEPLNLAGFDSYSTVAPVSTNLGKRNARFVVVYDDSHAYLFTGVSRSSDQRRKFDNHFREAARSFHKLTAKEKQLAGSLKLHLITAGNGTRIETLASQSPIAKQAEPELRLLNDLYPKGEPQAGQTLKVVR